MYQYLAILVAGLQLCQAARNPLSGATLFLGGKSPIVNTGYTQYQGKNDDVTETSNYLGVPYASAPRFDHSVVHEIKQSGVQGETMTPRCNQNS